MFFKRRCTDCEAKDRDIEQLKQQNILLKQQLDKAASDVVRLQTSKIETSRSTDNNDNRPVTPETSTDILVSSHQEVSDIAKKRHERIGRIENNRKRTEQLRRKHKNSITNSQVRIDFVGSGGGFIGTVLRLLINTSGSENHDLKSDVGEAVLFNLDKKTGHGIVIVDPESATKLLLLGALGLKSSVQLDENNFDKLTGNSYCDVKLLSCAKFCRVPLETLLHENVDGDAYEFLLAQAQNLEPQGVQKTTEKMIEILSRPSGNMNRPTMKNAAFSDAFAIVKRRKAGNESKEASLRAVEANRTARLDHIVNIHYRTLKRNIEKSLQRNDYGGVVSDGRKDEFVKFLTSTGFEISNSKRLYETNSSYLSESCASEEFDKLVVRIEQDKREAMRSGFDPNSIPSNGFDFEYWVANSLALFGWKATVSTASGDQGVDVVAELNDVSVGIQCKLYSGSVGNKAVQEIISGIAHYGLDRAVVISNAIYTKSAYDLASSTNVLLLSHRDIPELWSTLKDQRP